MVVGCGKSAREVPIADRSFPNILAGWPCNFTWTSPLSMCPSYSNDLRTNPLVTTIVKAHASIIWTHHRMTLLLDFPIAADRRLGRKIGPDMSLFPASSNKSAECSVLLGSASPGNFAPADFSKIKAIYALFGGVNPAPLPTRRMAVYENGPSYSNLFNPNYSKKYSLRQNDAYNIEYCCRRQISTC